MSTPNADIEKRVRSRRVLYVTLIGMLATGFPFTILTVALGQIAEEFNVTEALATWSVSAPMLISAVSLPLLGKLGDMYGHRRLFIFGIAGSTVFAALCFFAWDIWSLIAFRVISMLLAGATTPSAMALLFHVFTDDERTRVIGWWSMGGPGSAALGLILGGPLVDLFGWRSVFMFQIIAGVIAWVIAVRALPETEARPAAFDHLGNIALIVSLLFLLFSVGSISEAGVASWVKWSALVLGAVGMLAFFRFERQVAHPIVPPMLLKARNFNAPVATSFLLQGSYLGGLVATPLVLIGHFGYSVSVAAAMMLVRTASLTIATPVGHGFAQPPLTSVIATAVPPSMFGTASGVSRLASQIGSPLGLSLFGALLSVPAEDLGLPMIFVIGMVISFLGLIPAYFIQSSKKRHS